MRRRTLAIHKFISPKTKQKFRLLHISRTVTVAAFAYCRRNSIYSNSIRLRIKWWFKS